MVILEVGVVLAVILVEPVLVVVVLLASTVVPSSIIEVSVHVVWAAFSSESLLDLLIAVLVLLRLECKGHHFRVDGFSWLSEFVVFVSEMALFSEGTDLM